MISIQRIINLSGIHLGMCDCTDFLTAYNSTTVPSRPTLLKNKEH